MSDQFNFWTHGAAVIVQHTQEYTGHDYGLFLERGGHGAIVQQRQGTGNWFHFAETYCAKTIKDGKEPVMTGTLKIIASTDKTIINLLAIRIIDKLLVMVDEAGLERKFWIDGKKTKIYPHYVTADFNLREITSLENIPGLFEVDIDKIDDTEEVIA